MIRGTTPTHTFALPFDTSAVKSAKVIYVQSDAVVLEKTSCTMDGNTLSVRLTQEETLKFDCKKNVEIQLRILTEANDALTSDIITIDVARCLDEEVLV